MMFHFLAADSSGFGGLFSALGLNWQSFLLNLAAFLVTAYIVGRWIFPPLTRALDAKKNELEAAARLEKEAGTKLEEAHSQAGKIVHEARGEADEILVLSREQAAQQLDEARLKAEARAERTLKDAREQLARDVRVAREELKSDTAKLVADATESILGEKLDAIHDTSVIERSLEKHR
jgi:F-type H+-transporting ATPase subunit b